MVDRPNVIPVVFYIMKNNENMKLNWKFQGVGGSKPKNLPWGNNMNPRFQV